MAVEVLDSSYLGINALVLFGWQLTFFIISATLKFDKVTDFAGGTGFLISALLTLLLNQTYYARQIVITVLVALWSGRLAGFLLYRILRWGEDRRFDELRTNILKLSAFWIFQFVWNFVVSLPVIFINSQRTNPRIGAWDIIGWIVFSAGLIVETLADIQKSAFKASPEGKGRWCDAGLWKYSRHPNYFGEMKVWWGALIASVPALGGTWRWVAILSPLYTTAILLFLSGVPLGEASANKKYGKNAEYLEYRRQTSILIPLPNSFYRGMPESVKRTILFDFPMYREGLDAVSQEKGEQIV